MNGYVAIFREHPRNDDIFYTDSDVSSIMTIQYIKESDTAFFMNYGGGRDRWYRKKTAYYEFHYTYEEAVLSLSRYFKELAQYKMTESENFRKQSRVLREKSRNLKRIAKS